MRGIHQQQREDWCYWSLCCGPFPTRPMVLGFLSTLGANGGTRSTTRPSARAQKTEDEPGEICVAYGVAVGAGTESRIRTRPKPKRKTRNPMDFSLTTAKRA